MVLPPLVVTGEEKRDAGIPRALFGPPLDFSENRFRRGALSPLEKVGRARELRVEIAGDRTNPDVRTRERRRQKEEKDEGSAEPEHESGKREKRATYSRAVGGRSEIPRSSGRPSARTSASSS